MERVKKARESAAIRIGPNRPRESQPHSSAPHLGKRKRPNVTTRDEHAPEAKSLRARYPKHWPARKVEVRGGPAVDDGKPIGETFVVGLSLSLSLSLARMRPCLLCVIDMGGLAHRIARGA